MSARGERTPLPNTVHYLLNSMVDTTQTSMTFFFGLPKIYFETAIGDFSC